MKNERFTGGDNLTNLEKYVHEIMMLNELKGGTGGYKLSHAILGQSGYSFGGNQMDLTHNDKARTVLKEILTENNVKIEKIDCFIKVFKEKGKLAQADITLIDAALSSSYGMRKLNEIYVQEISKIIAHVKLILKNIHAAIIPFSNDFYLQLVLIDYHNQFGLDINGKMHQVLQGKKVEFSKSFTLDFAAIKTSSDLIQQIRKAISCTKWGSSAAGRNDIERRQHNIDIVAKKNDLLKNRCDDITESQPSLATFK